nr:hypothetical protein CFP56_44467 [Quercus suber]
MQTVRVLRLLGSFATSCIVLCLISSLTDFWSIVPPVLAAASTSIQSEISTIQTLAALASKHPYYKFNYAWTRQMQDVTLSILLNGWLERSSSGRTGSDLLLTIEEVGALMGGMFWFNAVATCPEPSGDFSLLTKDPLAARSPRQHEDFGRLPSHHRRVSARAHLAPGRACAASAQQRHARRSRASAADRAVHQGRARRVSAAQLAQRRAEEAE